MYKHTAAAAYFRAHFKLRRHSAKNTQAYGCMQYKQTSHPLLISARC